ncbi:DUF4172 domain-containing protein [Sulfurovum sp. bin170]|nr:DUF4172 domain-containing protein [Sulfurovum sp. bin170]
MNTKKWIWQHQDFPNFNYDYKEIEPMIFRFFEKSGELKGKISYLSNSEQDNFSI